MKLPEDHYWHKDAIVYQLHVRAYYDSNGDGIGDFAGLSTKLDYLKDLGVTALWLLPFYPSPLRDDGYDIADYRGVHPDYGTLADFRHFLREAHKRGLRVITELVINHTSDQHPWFQAARAAAPGSTKRDYYVWSETAMRYEGARIIFTDYEKSNWAWDDTAKAYYWHRFFSHQPDLNFDNPHVVRAVLRAMNFWLDVGVDGLRLDAIPYLIEREGTNCENLPETHAVIKHLRAELDRRYTDRIFLAEANQWPEDVREYFGDGDECHMAFHFPLMPRIFMAIAQEDRHPITEIMAQTPEIPENCQWAIFLRNHDELTLEMVTDRERDYMYDVYATDPRARLNLGIRRRLAPLMDNDRAKIELLNSVLLSMPGTPIIYYGDEIGMGDNIYLGDRNGVRTPMQWGPDRNAGFSRTDPQRLYLPPIMDPVFGYEALNVEAQSRNASSLLNWMRRLIATRAAHKAFGRGGITFLRPGNRKILAYVREHHDEVILCVVNLSRSAQPVELDLAAYKGRVLVELLGRSVFPAIGELPYLLSLPRYGFYWFRLAADVDAPVWHVDKLPREELPVLVLPEGLLAVFMAKAAGEVRDVLAHKTVEQLKSVVLPGFLTAQGWFAGKGRQIAGIALEVNREWRGPEGREWLPVLIKVTFTTGATQSYFLPLGLLLDQAAERQYHLLSPWMLAKVRQRAKVGMLYDALGEDAFCSLLLDTIVRSGRLPFAAGEMVFMRAAACPDLPAVLPVARPGLEQSNTSLVFGEQVVLKVYRRVQEGINPELEMGRFLSEISPCPNIAPLAGAMEYHSHGTVTAIGVMHRYIPNQGSAWHYTRDYLDRYFTLCIEEPDRAHEQDVHALYLEQMATLGRRSGELHRALAVNTGNPAFDPEPLSARDLAVQSDRIRELLVTVFDKLEKEYQSFPAHLYGTCEHLLGARVHAMEVALRPVAGEQVLYKTRIHGNFHLGQVLITHNDFVITDFEGDPDRPLEERRAKYSPLKDVAGLRYSLEAAAVTALHRHLAERPDHRDLLEPLARAWRDAALAAFSGGYRAAMTGCVSFPVEAGQVQAVTERHLLDKALEEVGAALAGRVSELETALRILLDMLEIRPVSESL
ncbi:MAG: maltose alpha-D-glucosyltransferase [Pseudomonadota bacterium]